MIHEFQWFFSNMWIWWTQNSYFVFIQLIRWTSLLWQMSRYDTVRNRQLSEIIVDGNPAPPGKKPIKGSWDSLPIDWCSHWGADCSTSRSFQGGVQCTREERTGREVTMNSGRYWMYLEASQNQKLEKFKKVAFRKISETQKMQNLCGHQRKAIIKDLQRGSKL